MARLFPGRHLVEAPRRGRSVGAFPSGVEAALTPRGQERSRPSPAARTLSGTDAGRWSAPRICSYSKSRCAHSSASQSRDRRGVGGVWDRNATSPPVVPETRVSSAVGRLWGDVGGGQPRFIPTRTLVLYVRILSACIPSFDRGVGESFLALSDPLHDFLFRHMPCEELWIVIQA